MEFEKVREVVSAQMGIDPDSITINTNFTDDLGIDSLDIYIITQELEEIFDIEFTNDEAERIKTVEDVVNYIKDLRK